jgi:hypothetical protein
MSLLKDIEQGACDSKVDLAMLLRKCQVLMSRLDNKPAEEWVEHELNGYPEHIPVPPYRKLPMVLKGDFDGGFRQANDFTILPKFVPEKIRAQTQMTEYRKSVSSIAHLLEGASAAKTGSLTVPMGDLPLYLDPVFPDMVCIAVRGVLGTAAVHDILNQVRNRLLKLSLELQKQYPSAGEERMDERSHAGATQVINNVIYGDAQVVGMAEQSTITMNVAKGDLASLKKALKQIGLAPADVSELRDALKSEPKLEGKHFGPKVAAWLKKMAAKAASGILKVGTDVAINALEKAILGYYGF